jgi:hypothetical protein
MSNSWYAKGLEHFASGDINFLTANVKAALVTSAYTPAATDEFLAVISGISGAIVSRSGSLAGKTITGGVLNCSNFTVPLVPSGHVIKYVVFYKDTGVDGTSPLLIVDDTGNNLPTTTDGGDLQYQVSPGPNKLGTLGGTVVT